MRPLQFHQNRCGIAIYATLLFLGSLAFLIPFYFILNGSLKTEEAVQAGDFIHATQIMGGYSLVKFSARTLTR